MLYRENKFESFNRCQDKRKIEMQTNVPDDDDNERYNDGDGDDEYSSRIMLSNMIWKDYISRPKYKTKELIKQAFFS